MIRKIIATVAVTISSGAFTQTVNMQKLDDFFKALDENHKVMGSFAIAQNDKIVYTKAIGFSDVEKKLKSNVNTVYRIGSISKTFTAVLIMHLVEKGQLKLDEKLSKYFPQIKNSEKISVEDLLNHRSGIHNFTDTPQFLDYNFKPISKEELVKKIVAGGSDFEPGSKYAYSNSNYSILAMILEKVAGKSYQYMLESLISRPLNLKFTKIGTPINSSKNEAASYTYLDKAYQKSVETDMSVPIGAGNIVTTPSELLIFIAALQNGKLLKPASLTKMKNFKDAYGFGLVEIPFGTSKGFGHDGAIDDFRSVLFYFPEGKKSIAFITNQSSYDNNQISINLLNAASGLDFEIPQFKDIILTDKLIEKYIGNYASEGIPVKIKIFSQNGQLNAQATGQSAFPLEPVSENTFKFDAAGIVVKFAENDTFAITQGGKTHIFKKEN